MVTCYHKVAFCTAEDVDIEEMLCLCLSQRRFQIAVETVLDKLLRKRHVKSWGYLYLNIYLFNHLTIA